MNTTQIVALIGVFVFVVGIPLGYAFYRAWKIAQLKRFLTNNPIPAEQSIATPLGYVPFRVINPDASLESGLERAKQRSYATDGIPFGREMTDEEDAAFWQEHPELIRFRDGGE